MWKWLTLFALVPALTLPASSVTTLPQGQASAPAAMDLKGLWSLHASFDAGWMSTQDVADHYAPGSLTLSDQSLAYGYSLRATRHLTDSFFLGLGLDAMTKSVRLRDSANDRIDLFEWNALFPSAALGWTFYRTPSAFFNVEGQVGWVGLNRATWYQEGSGASGDFTGSTLGWVAGMGGTWFLIPSVGLHASAGWRSARIIPAAYSGDSAPVVTPTYVRDFSIDFSGPVLRLGVSFFWGRSNPWGDMREAPEAPPPPRGTP